MKKEKKRKSATPRMGGKNLQKGSMYHKKETARHPSGGPNQADKVLYKMTRSGVGP